MRIGEMIRKAQSPFFSLEFFPPANPDQLPEFYATAEELGKLKPLFVSVTYGAGGANQHRTSVVAAKLAQLGFTVMTHLTCVGADSQKITSYIEEMKAQGVDNILALRGDPPKGQKWDWKLGAFHHAVDLVRFIRTNFPDMGIGVAAYPAPHPESGTFEEDRQFTAEKLEAGAEFAITQLFFDVREYTELMATLKRKNIDVPVVPGILPIQSLESLKRVLSLCGANIPGKLFLDLEAAHAKGGTEAVREEGLAFAIAQIRKLLSSGAPGIHLYTLNKSNLCQRIIKECNLQ